MAEIRAVEVRIWDKSVGAIAPLAGRPGVYEFEYDPAFVRLGIELSPLNLPSKTGVRYSFPTLNPDTFRGLPGVIADALPDKFGNALIDEYMARKGTKAVDITTLQRLLYAGHRSMGALEFEPALTDINEEQVAEPLEMASLVEDARRAMHGNLDVITKDIIDVGSSAGGARAKALIGWNPKTNDVVSGQFSLPDGFEHWLLKFDVDSDGTLGFTSGFGRIEYAHYEMATAAGIEMSQCRLLEENGRAHFMTKRFDRSENRKVHLHSLCGLAHLDFNTPYVHGYEQYLRATLQMGLGAPAIEQAWLRCAFNVAAVNCDDHTKNLAFLMDESGQWRLAPAFDMCFAHNPRPDKWTHKHQMLVRGKAWDMTGQDMIELGAEFGVNQPRILLEEITDVIRRWPEFARNAGVPATTVSQIASLQPSLKVAARLVRDTTKSDATIRPQKRRSVPTRQTGKKRKA
ncbi:MAG: type II toxin-antitoxin system HipA family toxin [Vicinamibacterales bacterium]